MRALLELDGCEMREIGREMARDGGEMARGGGEIPREVVRSVRDQDARLDTQSLAHSHVHARGRAYVLRTLSPYVPRLRQRACIFSGCWVLNFHQP